MEIDQEAVRRGAQTSLPLPPAAPLCAHRARRATPRTRRGCDVARRPHLPPPSERRHSADVSSLGGTSIDLAGLVEGAATEEGAYQGGTKLTAAGVEDPTPASDALLSRVHEVRGATPVG